MNTKVNTDHLHHIAQIAQEDVAGVIKAEQQYGSSWRRRGGVGAYMMLCRKFDRIEQQLSKPLITPSAALLPAAEALRTEGAVIPPYDIFGHAKHDLRAEGIIDDIRDLRRYLLLVEGALRAMGVQHGVHRDNAPEKTTTCVSAEQAITTVGGMVRAVQATNAESTVTKPVEPELRYGLTSGEDEVRQALLAERGRLGKQVEAQMDAHAPLRELAEAAKAAEVPSNEEERRRLGVRVPDSAQRLGDNRTITEVMHTPRKTVHSAGYDDRPIEKQVPREHGD